MLRSAPDIFSTLISWLTLVSLSSLPYLCIPSNSIVSLCNFIIRFFNCFVYKKISNDVKRSCFYFSWIILDRIIRCDEHCFCKWFFNAVCVNRVIKFFYLFFNAFSIIFSRSFNNTSLQLIIVLIINFKFLILNF